MWAEGNQINKSYILQIRKSKIEQMRSLCRNLNIEMQVAIADLKSAIDDTYKTEHFGWFNYSMYNRFTDVSLFFIAHQLKTVQAQIEKHISMMIVHW